MFKFNYKIQNEDINYGGHVGNERALLFFQMARMELFKSLGASELDLGEGAGVIQKNSYVQYNKELFLDDEIEIEIVNINFSNTSFDIKYEIYDRERKLVIEGSTLLICYDYYSHKIKKIPLNFKNKVLSLNEVK